VFAGPKIGEAVLILTLTSTSNRGQVWSFSEVRCVIWVLGTQRHPRWFERVGSALITIAQFAKPFSVKMIPLAALTAAGDRVFAN
jgi:hypothetical protein